MQIRYLVNSTTLVESFNHNFVFSSIISVATFKLTCLTVSQQNYDAVKERRSMSLHTLFILLFVLSFPILYDTSTVTFKTDFLVGKFTPSL